MNFDIQNRIVKPINLRELGNGTVGSVCYKNTNQSLTTLNNTTGNSTSGGSNNRVSNNLKLKGTGKPMTRGKKEILSNYTLDMGNLDICVGWESNSSFHNDLDFSCFLCDRNSKVINDEYFVFYNQEKSPDGSVRYVDGSGSLYGNNTRVININLDKINQQVEKLIFVLTIDNAKEDRVSFSKVQKSFMCIVDKNTGNELVQFTPDNLNPNATSIAICEIYRHNGNWKIKPMGDGLENTDIRDLCQFYGVSV